MRDPSSLRSWVVTLGMVLVASGCFRGWDEFDPRVQGGTSTGTGTGIGVGAGSAAMCGGVGVLTDEFDDGVIDDRFQSDDETVFERDGELVLALPDAATGCGSASFGSEHAYDLTGRSIGFELSALPEPPASPYLRFSLSDAGSNSVEIAIDPDDVSFRTTVMEDTQTLASQRYAAADHRFFRFREADGKVYWETSSDGQSWVERAKEDVASLFDIRYVFLDLSASGDGGDAPTEIRIADLDGGEPEVHCAMSTFTDDFEDGVRSGAWAVPGCIENCAMAETNGELAFMHQAAVTSSCSYTSTAAYDLRGGAVSIELTSPPEPSSEGALTVKIIQNSDNHLDFTIRQGELYCVQALDGECGEDLAFTQFSAQNHRWLRFREQAGTVHFETSADGVDWHPHTASIEPFALDAVAIAIESWTTSEPLGPLEIRLDNVNLAP